MELIVLVMPRRKYASFCFLPCSRGDVAAKQMHGLCLLQFAGYLPSFRKPKLGYKSCVEMPFSSIEVGIAGISEKQDEFMSAINVGKGVSRFYKLGQISV
jgi:hypothetical protein